MTILADFLRDSSGKAWRIYADENGALVVSDVSTASQESESWTDSSYTVPTTFTPIYRTLADSAGNIWYIYPDTNGGIVVDDTEPTAIAGVWVEPDYGLDESEASTGNEIYLALKDVAEKDWYFYPNSDGSYTMTDTEPS